MISALAGFWVTSTNFPRFIKMAIEKNISKKNRNNFLTICVFFWFLKLIDLDKQKNLSELISIILYFILMVIHYSFKDINDGMYVVGPTLV
jgi:hypothetical protein